MLSPTRVVIKFYQGDPREHSCQIFFAFEVAMAIDPQLYSKGTHLHYSFSSKANSFWATVNSVTLVSVLWLLLCCSWLL